MITILLIIILLSLWDIASLLRNIRDAAQSLEQDKYKAHREAIERVSHLI